MNRAYLSSKADDLLKTYEESRKMAKLSSIASNLTATLMGVPEEVVVSREVSKQVPVLTEMLQKHLVFYEAKSEWNGNITNLQREIAKCDEISASMNTTMTLTEAKECLKWINHVKIKYGFSSM